MQRDDLLPDSTLKGRYKKVKCSIFMLKIQNLGKSIANNVCVKLLVDVMIKYCPVVSDAVMFVKILRSVILGILMVYTLGNLVSIALLSWSFFEKHVLREIGKLFACIFALDICRRILEDKKKGTLTLIYFAVFALLVFAINFVLSKYIFIAVFDYVENWLAGIFESIYVKLSATYGPVIDFFVNAYKITTEGNTWFEGLTNQIDDIINNVKNIG